MAGMSSPLPQVTIRIAEAGLRAAVERALEGAADAPVEVVGPEGPSAPDALWIAVVDTAAAALDAVRRGAVDALTPETLDRLPIALEQARRALDHRGLARVVALLPDPVEITGADMRYLEVNPAFERLFGLPR